MSENDNTSTVLNFVIGFVIGSLIGGILALLFAPQSGASSRNMIKVKSLEIKERASEAGGEWVRLTQERGSELQKHGIKLVEEKIPSSPTKTTDTLAEELPESLNELADEV